MHRIALCDLPKGAHGKISEIRTNDSMRRRLQDIGFVKGATVEHAFSSPLGDPVAYHIKGTVVALRCEEASQILLE